MNMNIDKEGIEILSKKNEGNKNIISRNKTKMGIMCKEIVQIFFKRTFLVLLGYVFCFCNWSFFLLMFIIGILVWLENEKREKRTTILNKSRASTLAKHELENILKEMPSWVNFPDFERAEWLNEIILQLWPSLSNYLIRLMKGKLEKNIKKKYESFNFEYIDFGVIPPKIDGVKVYKKEYTKDSIIIDFDVIYDGDCDIKCNISGTHIGRIKDVQVCADMRLILKPILIKMPLLGGIQIFFLNTPDINFDIDGITAYAGLSYFIRQKIEEQISKHLVFPNKFTKRFVKTTEALELKSLEPQGVLRVHVFEAKDLEKKDVTGKSDPYVQLCIGAQEYKTNVINRSLNPKWDYWCEFIVLDPEVQQLYFKLYDEDYSGDDFLGSGVVELSTILKGDTDQWITLQQAKHGKIHLRFTWFALSSDFNQLADASREANILKVKNLSTALLTVFVDSMENLPRSKSYKKPDPYFTLTVGKRMYKSSVKKHTTDPIWEQGTSLLIPSPNSDTLTIQVFDKSSGVLLLEYNYDIKSLTNYPKLQVSKEEIEIDSDGMGTKLVISLQLRILKNDKFVDEETESDTDSDMFDSLHFSNRSINSSSTALSKQISLDRDTPESLSRRKESPLVIKKTVASTLHAERILDRDGSLNKSVLGQIEVTLFYSVARQKLIVTIHQLCNLPMKDPDDLPDPYVKLKLMSMDNPSIKHKTKIIMDECNPVFNETFEYLVSKPDLPKYTLLLTVKTKKFFSNKNVIGQVVLELKDYNLEEESRIWFNLFPKN